MYKYTYNGVEFVEQRTLKSCRRCHYDTWNEKKNRKTYLRYIESKQKID